MVSYYLPDEEDVEGCLYGLSCCFFVLFVFFGLFILVLATLTDVPCLHIFVCKLCSVNKFVLSPFISYQEPQCVLFSSQDLGADLLYVYCKPESMQIFVNIFEVVVHYRLLVHSEAVNQGVKVYLDSLE